MRRIGGFCFVLASLVATPAVVNAQRCLGTASFADGHLRAQVGTSSLSGWRYYQAGLAIGRERGAFVSGGASRGRYRDFDFTNNGLSASVGYQVPLGTRLQLCPKLNVARSTSTWYGGGSHTDYWGNAIGISTAVGASLWSSPRFDLVPSAELSFAVSSARMQSATQGIEREVSASGRTGALSLASGLIFGKVVTVSPFISVPLGVRGVGTVSGVALSVSFGSRQ